MKTRRPVSIALSAALFLSSWGPGASSAFAQKFSVLTAGVSSVPQLRAVPAINASLPLVPAVSASLLAPISVVAVPVSVAPTVRFPVASVVKPSALEAVKPSAGGEVYGRAAAEDFSRRVSGEDLAHWGGDVSGPAAVSLESSPTAPALAHSDKRSSVASARIPRPATKPEGEKRSASFPLWMAAISGSVWGGLDLARWGVGALSASAGISMGSAVLTGAAASALFLTGAFAVMSVLDVGVLAAALWRGRGVSDAQLSAVLREQVLDERYGLNGNLAALIRPYRPDNRFSDLTLAFVSRGQIWVRPELAAWPWLLRKVVQHEWVHMSAESARGPPQGGARGLLSSFISEVKARAAEFKGPRALKQIAVSALQRSLIQSQTSLRLSRPYDVLVLNPDGKELADPKLYESLSGGEAHVTLVKDSPPAPALADAGGRYRAIVLGGAAAALPPPNSKSALRLETVLKKLDSLNLLATKLVVRGSAFDNAKESGAWNDLVDRAQRLRADSSPQAREVFEDEVRKLWRQIVSQRLTGVGVSELIERIYGGLSDRGSAFLSFGPDEHGVVSWEKLLRYWESADGGQFRVKRVDLEDGGHMLIMRKVEARVGLWLRPVQGGRIVTSVANASLTEEGRTAAKQALADAGLASQVELFDKLEVVVRHVFGADVGRQEIYVTVPRRNANAIRKFVSPTVEVVSSLSNFQPHLMDSAELQNVKPVFQAGITGADGSIFWIDTGADATHEDFGGRLDVVDMVDEGPEDWLGHGTHVAGISISGNPGFLGMAKAAMGTMAKVFSRDQNGATDGDIMAAAVVAMKRGLKAVDVISLSFGQRGSSGDNLADFFSELTKRKSAAGEYPIVTASAGNSGPFNRTLSQPAAGVDVLAVAAAAKSKDDGVPEIAFYSSVGPDIDQRYTIKRFRFKPDITGIGGDVVTLLGSISVYLFGVFSAKSKDAPRNSADLPDGKHTGMSGTSQSNPAVAAIALLVKQALRLCGALTPFVAENLPFVVKAVLMRSARDMGVPVWFQGAGLVDAWAAVSLVAAPVAGESAWDWVVRLKAVQDAEDRVYRESELAKSQDADIQQRFNAAAGIEVPRLLEALKDPVWLVRQRAAAALMNLKSPASEEALVEAGLRDADARVRQMAFLALAEMRSSSTNTLLQKAAESESWDVRVYAADALARRGDRSALGRVVKEMTNTDKRARFTSAWILGQTASLATAAESESLSAHVRDRAERGNIRHLAAASLSYQADAAPETFTDRVVSDLLDAAGPENLALTRTIGQVFPAALRSKAFVARLRAEPLKPIVRDFVIKNRDALGKPGSLNELVALLARAADIPLDAPTALMDPAGAGVLGVDETVGPVDLIAVPPSGVPSAFHDESDPQALARAASESGLDAATLARFETTARAALPLSRGLWLSVPEHKLYALTITLEHRGWSVRRGLPYYPLTNAPSEAGGLTIDLGDGSGRADVPAGVDLALVRVRASGGVSEARVIAALERVGAAARGKSPSVVALTIGAPVDARGTPLSAVIDRLVASGVGVVVGAGNAGPNLGTVSAPGDLAVVVAAASRGGLQFYSARGTPDQPRVTWTDLVDDLQPGEMIAAAATAAAGAVLAAPAEPAKALGTAVAAERTAAKLAILARALSSGLTAKGLSLPEGWFPYLTALVKSSATAMPALGADEVGAGLFDEQKALDLLKERLRDPEKLVREAKALSKEAHSRVAPPSSPVAPAGLLRRALRAAWGWISSPFASAASRLTERAVRGVYSR